MNWILPANWISALPQCQAAACNFDRTPTAGIIVFEIFVAAATLIALLLAAQVKRHVLFHYSLMAVGVFIFEFFTSPMWNNFKLGEWAYFYRDVSWVLTVGWTTMALSVVVLVDWLLPRWREWQRFLLYLAALTGLVVVFETIVVGLGIRSYAPEVLDTLVGVYLLGAPIETLYYVPVFMALVISFYKYWSFALEGRPLAPIRRGKWRRNFAVTLAGVLLFELMIEPMVVNAKLPAWSYVYRDISIIFSLTWVVILWLSLRLVEQRCLHRGLPVRFGCYLAAVTAISAPLESWLIANGYRVYGPSAVANFSGFQVPWLNLPVEVLFGIPLYLALVIAFIKYWEIALDNRL